MDIVKFKRIRYPEFLAPSKIGSPSLNELDCRLSRARESMAGRGLDYLVVYGDREHFANITYLTNFDPRFEEALFILGMESEPLILVGNEGVGHLGVSPLFVAGKMRHERYQSFSLLGQPKGDSRQLKDIFLQEGLDSSASVGVVGWKYYNELSDSENISDVPAYIWDTLKSCCKSVVNATDLLMSPSYGLRSRISAYEAALFERSNIMASEAVKAMLFNIRPGMTDFELMSKVPFTGYPLSCHPSVKSSGNISYGLSSPTGDVIREGQSCSMSVAYWGSNLCRAGWVVKDESGLPSESADYVESFAGPFFVAVRNWFRKMRIGVTGGEIYRSIQYDLPYEKFGVYLNPGHLIHYDEWLSSPIYEGSKETVESGMLFQSDIIPRSSIYSSCRMEEGILIADEGLRRELMLKYPYVYARCMQRRVFMESLGFELPEEILPLSNIAGIVPPYFLDPELVLSL